MMIRPRTLITKIILLACTVLISTACNRHIHPRGGKKLPAQNRLSKTEKEAGWELLFDGKSLAGWHRYGHADIGKAWVIHDASIHLNASARTGEWQTSEGGDIVSAAAFDNFHLKYDWKIAPGGNSGLIFYVQEDTAKYKWGWQSGPEMQVLDNATHADAKIYKHRAGDLYDLIASRSEPVKPALEWNHAEIISKDGALQCYLNGVLIISTLLWTDEWNRMIAASKFKDMPGFGTYHSGKISLQDHGDNVWFRNIKIRRLGSGG